MHAAEILEASGKGGTVRAFDLSPKRTARMQENLERMRITNLQIRCRDASQPVPEEERETADVLLCDVPCSGLGVMGRKRDIKYRVTPEEIRKLVPLQRQIVRESAALLKHGGTLIYSTCTISREENEETAAFIREELGLRPDSLLPFMPARDTVRDSVQENMLQLLPNIHGTDGFFIARFVKP
jgi:16S rRNA (cytosine967-C5)-methyltransferase